MKAVIKKIIYNPFFFKIIPSNLLFGEGFQRASLFNNSNFGNEKKLSTYYKNLFSTTGISESIFEKGLWPSIHNFSTGIAGFIPYQKSETSLVIYNFWSLNYGLRKQILGNIILLKNKKIKNTLKFNLHPDQLRHLDLRKPFKDDDGDIIFVEIFHPKFPKNHGGNNGHLRFWGDYSRNRSTAHSLPFHLIIRDTKINSSRASFADIDYKNNDNKIKFIHFYKNQMVQVKDHIFSKLNHGYFLQVYKRFISSVWHSAAYSGTKNVDSKDLLQLVALPPLKGIDVQLSFIESFTSRKPEKVTFSLFNSKAKLITKKTLKISHLDRIRCSEIFPNTLLANKQLLVDFSNIQTPLHNVYIHLFYFVNNVLGDCVHSHRAEAPSKLMKNKSLFNRGCRQALKFMHFTKQKGYTSYLAIWTTDNKNFAKLRFINSAGDEYIKNISIDSLGIIYYPLDKILHALGGVSENHYIVQLQSNSANLMANLYTFCNKNQSLSVDHLTGG